MSENSKRIRLVILLVTGIIALGISAGGCVKPGTSGLTFYEFYDPT